MRHSKYHKKYEPCQFDTFCRESALQYTCAQCKVLQNLCVSKITAHHFPGVVQNPKLRTLVHKQRFSSTSERYVFRKTKFYVKQLKIKKFILDIKQLKMNKSIIPMWQLIISTSNATFEVHSPRPWVQQHSMPRKKNRLDTQKIHF